MTQPYPLPRQTRETTILLGDGGRIYGPFGFQIFDIEDVVVLVERQDGAFERTNAVTVAKTTSDFLSPFTVTFDEDLTGDSKFIVRVARVHERSIGVSKGSAIGLDALEREFSKQASVMQELRRDNDQALRLPAGLGLPLVAAPLHGRVATWDLSEAGKPVLRPGPSEAEISAAGGFAAAALAARDELLVASTPFTRDILTAADEPDFRTKAGIAGNMFQQTYDPLEVRGNAFDSANTVFVNTGTEAISRAVKAKLSDTINKRDFTSLGAAITAAGNGCVVISDDNDTTALPSSYTATVEYLGASQRRWTHAGDESLRVRRALRAQHQPRTSGQTEATFHIDLEAVGNFNGPNSGDYGLSINAVKKGFAQSGINAALGGEVNCQTLFLRQDGPKGLPSGDPGSSDGCAILANVQNILDSGFVAFAEATTSNLNADFSLRRAVNIQIGTMDGNNANGLQSIGFVANSRDGNNDHAFYATRDPGATWENLFFAPDVLRIDGDDGSYNIISPTYPVYASRFQRGPAANDETRIDTRGTGGLVFNVENVGSITFATDNTPRAFFNGGNTFLAATNRGTNLGGGDSFRWGNAWFGALDVSAAAPGETNINFGNLPTSNPGEPGRLWINAGVVNVS